LQQNLGEKIQRKERITLHASTGLPAGMDLDFAPISKMPRVLTLGFVKGLAIKGKEVNSALYTGTRDQAELEKVFDV